MKYLIGFLLFCLTITLNGKNTLNYNISAFIEGYIATDNDNTPKKWDGGTNYRKLSPNDYLKNEFAINLAEIGINLEYSDYGRGQLFFQAGNLPEYAFGEYYGLQQAWAGINVFKNLWIDIGRFFTHIGTESYSSKDNWLISHSLLTMFEPYYHQGMKISWETENYTIGFHILNGNGIFEDNNANKTFGSYLSYDFTKDFTLSYAGLFGNEISGPPAFSQLHTFHNLSLYYYPTKAIKFKVQLDYSTLENGYVKNSNDTVPGSFLGLAAQMKYQITKYLSSTLRLMYIDNKKGVYSISDKGFIQNYLRNVDTYSLTYGIEYKPFKNGYIRLETRYINLGKDDEDESSTGKIFRDGDVFTNTRTELMLNIGIWVN